MKDLDCPAPGCPAFRVTFPPKCTGGQTEKCFVANDSSHRPKPMSFDFTMDPYWNNDFNLENVDTAAQQCLYTAQPDTTKACPAVKP